MAFASTVAEQGRQRVRVYLVVVMLLLGLCTGFLLQGISKVVYSFTAYRESVRESIYLANK